MPNILNNLLAPFQVKEHGMSKAFPLCTTIVCCFIFSMAQSIKLTYLPLYLFEHLHWSAMQIGASIGLMSFGGVLAFVGGFLGDRTFKRKLLLGAGLIAEGIAMLLLATLDEPMLNTGFVLCSLATLLFQGNIFVLVASFTTRAGVALELAFVISFSIVRLGQTIAPLISMSLFEGSTIFVVPALLTIAAGLFWLLKQRSFMEIDNANVGLETLSGQYRMLLLILVFAAPRLMNLAFSKAFTWTAHGQDNFTSLHSLGLRIQMIEGIVGLASILIIPIVVHFAIGWFRKQGALRAGSLFVCLAFAARGVSLLILGLGAGASIAKYKICLAVACLALSASNVLIFAGIATIVCTIAPNRWRGTATALIAGFPAGTALATSTWQVWPLALPLLMSGGGFLLASGLWHLFVTKRFAPMLVPACATAIGSA